MISIYGTTVLNDSMHAYICYFAQNSNVPVLEMLPSFQFEAAPKSVAFMLSTRQQRSPINPRVDSTIMLHRQNLVIKKDDVASTNKHSLQAWWIFQITIYRYEKGAQQANQCVSAASC